MLVCALLFLAIIYFLSELWIGAMDNMSDEEREHWNDGDDYWDWP